MKINPTISQNYLITIVGPTAIGKTKVAIELANHFHCDIVSADSRQFYRGMDIGTATPSKSELSLVRHHFINFLEPHEDYSAGRFESDAIYLLGELFKKNNIQVMAGGSGMYVSAVLYGFDHIPDVPKRVRVSLSEELNRCGMEKLLSELAGHDPAYFHKVDKNNTQRVIRALEVCRFTGKPYSSFRKKKAVPRNFTPVLIGLNTSRDRLYDNINARVEDMITNGLVEEVKTLYPYKNENALKTVGYQEIIDYLDDKLRLNEAVDLIKRNTRRYAKRQLTWFRRYQEISWFEPHDFEGILSLLHQKLNVEK